MTSDRCTRNGRIRGEKDRGIRVSTIKIKVLFRDSLNNSVYSAIIVTAVVVYGKVFKR